MEIIHEQKKGDTSRYVLSHNETELEIYVDAGSGTIKTDIRRQFLAPRVSGTVTELYREAAQIMRREATERNQHLRYVLATRNRQMRAWAESPDKGGSIFAWEKLEEKSGTLVGEITIFPKYDES